MTINPRRLALVSFGTLALTLSPAAVSAQSTMSFTPRAQRNSDEVIARDLAQFEALVKTATNARRAALVGLARDAYERNDEGALTSRLLAMSASVAGDPAARAHRPALWALLDSLNRQPGLGAVVKQQAVELEVALLRAGSSLLGAPSCASWDLVATRLADQLRRGLTVVAVAAPVAPPLVAQVPAVAPAAPAAPPVARALPSRVHFAFNKSTLSQASRRVLDAIVDSLTSYETVNIVLEGHTDVRGSVAYNTALSRRRVEAVRRYLLRKGLNKSPIRADALGKSKLEQAERDVTSHARNRRVTFQFFDAQGRVIGTVGQVGDLQPERR